MKWICVPQQLLQWVYIYLSQVKVKEFRPVELESHDVIFNGTVTAEKCAVNGRQVTLYEDAMASFDTIFPNLDKKVHCILLRELWFGPEFLPHGLDGELIVVHQSHCDNSISTLFLELDTAQACQLELHFDESWRSIHFCNEDGALQGLMLPGVQHPFLEGVVHRVVAQNSIDFYRHSLVIQLRQQVKK